MDALEGIARRFPLVARARPACSPLDKRVREICELARAASRGTGASRLPLAAQAHNKAALIASDCGLPDLARSLCQRQFGVYLHGQPLGAQEARYALEPIVNLARLLVRGGDRDGGYRLLDTVFQAVRCRTEVVIDGTPVSFQNLTDSDETHRTLVQWLWTVLLADATRALAGAGRWADALVHVEQHGGVGQRMLDGRQVAILAHCLAGDTACALVLLEESTLAESWEQTVAACLTLLCSKSGARPVETAVAAMVEHYLRLEPAPELVVFRTRLGLAVIDLAGGVEQPDAAQAASRLVNEAIAAEDGYVAREVLANKDRSIQLTSAEERKLSATLHSSGLGCSTIPHDLMVDLMAAVTMSETAMARHLDTKRAGS
jgi:hypothetical protein